MTLSEKLCDRNVRAVSGLYTLNPDPNRCRIWLQAAQAAEAALVFGEQNTTSSGGV
jgi:hypothetical protein